jgi:GTP:adenosylcobinamide-phosphate guanylyltransferase
MEAMYRITFSIIANYLQKINAEHNNIIISTQQKGFIKDIEGSTEHISKISLLLAHAITNKKPIYITAIDCKDAFGSLTHDILKRNLKKVGLRINLVNVIMDSYKDIFVRI